ncbi:MAG: alpha-amylase family glycosyl hydrolase [Bacteroidota bacterium]|nr:alpha-amylase family glycosyl hydrolase [Bacteroidota bacterium]
MRFYRLSSFNYDMVNYEFHVAKQARIKYEIESSLFNLYGDLIIANPAQARLLTKKLNDRRIAANTNEILVSAGQLNSFGLLHEIFHYVLNIYEKTVNPGVFERALASLTNQLGTPEVNKLFFEFINEFPPMAVYNNEITHFDFIEGTTANIPNKIIILQEIMLLHFENINPAAVSFKELFSDKDLIKSTQYPKTLGFFDSFFSNEAPLGIENLPLTDFLKKPILSNPNSLEAQLEYIKEKWGVIIKEVFSDKLLKSKDLLSEDALFFMPKGEFQKVTPDVPSYLFDKDYYERIKAKLAAGLELTADEKQFYYEESENFTQDIEWMPNVIMLAKNAYVWLFQLSIKYQREISTLDQIPDEELDQIARWNITSLWLIGLWERSNSSKKIKQIMGNPEAASSAYSLFDYQVAAKLGGDSAFENLKYRASQRNIKLASDMVPNHTGIYSKWIIEHPEYFIQSVTPPFPSYTFNSTNLSDDDRVEVRIEDKYYSKSDAAVVFQRRDKYTGECRYIYHGNDGTHMPWNDTAQLNLLNPEVRESLIQTIMHVARKTPIIRFDAAMTLTKKHYQRLWFPIPGTGAAIASRSDYSMTRSAFDDAMPNEFWREVVDRINTEMPETLLLAEAFWLMEGFFVRTLGMHRVYNSAFMHMLMKEENEKYKYLITSTIQFNPEILKRYVNFMSNPDEETAVNQFGKGDKYFGIAMLMATLPGLPMFAHGQIEGYAEKYGMEYSRSYYDEKPDDNLIKRHEQEIFPLLKKRYLFSQVHNFDLYDFIDSSGHANHNVFAYSNKVRNEKVFVIYNNAYETCYGRLNYSQERIANGNLRSIKFADALEIKNDYKYFYILKDTKTGLEYLYNGNDLSENGLFVTLSGYQYHVFTQFREVYDAHGEYENLSLILSGKGVPSVDYALKKLNLAPLHNAVEILYNPEFLLPLEHYLFIASLHQLESTEPPIAFLKDLDNLLSQLNYKGFLGKEENYVLSDIRKSLSGIRTIHEYLFLYHDKKNDPKWLKHLKITNKFISKDNLLHLISLILPLVIFKKEYFKEYLFSEYKLFDDLLLDNVLFESFERIGNNYEYLYSDLHLLKILIYNYDKLVSNSKMISGKLIKKKTITNALLTFIAEDMEARNYLIVNEYQGVKYFNKERLEYLLDWFVFINLAENNTGKIDDFTAKLKCFYSIVSELKEKAFDNNYKFEPFIALQPEEKAVTKEKVISEKENLLKEVKIVKKIIVNKKEAKPKSIKKPVSGKSGAKTKKNK